MHYFRIFPEQWRDRLSKLKAIGFNTVETYCCWNLHEPNEGEYRFDGMLDVERFIETAREEGLYVIVRPGPYICSEWDLGGLPAWLLKNDGIRLRSCRADYFDKAERYMKKLMSHIVPHLQTNGGKSGSMLSSLHSLINRLESVEKEPDLLAKSSSSFKSDIQSFSS